MQYYMVRGEILGFGVRQSWGYLAFPVIMCLSASCINSMSFNFLFYQKGSVISIAIITMQLSVYYMQNKEL